MSGSKQLVGARKIHWKTQPKGQEGTAWVSVDDGAPLEVRYRRDPHGIWLGLPGAVKGFDLKGSKNEEGLIEYQVSNRSGAEEWGSLRAVSAGMQALASAGGAKAKKGTRIRAQMPGKILRLTAQPGDAVEKDQPVLVMEAMKMENEIRSPRTGVIKSVHVTEGQAVETGADLILLE